MRMKRQSVLIYIRNKGKGGAVKHVYMTTKLNTKLNLRHRPIII